MKIGIEIYDPKDLRKYRCMSLDASEYLTKEPFLVSCLMVTRGNTNLIASALYCYENQTYSNRELVIVCDRVGLQLSKMIDAVASTSVRLIRAEEHQPLGALRNIAVSNAKGDLICVWDDDDLYNLDRIRVGVLALIRSRTAAVFLKRLLFWWPAREILAVSKRRAWEGSMIAWRTLIPSYAEIGRGEDTELLTEMRRQHRIGLINSPSLYCYIKHSNNTSDDAHFWRLVMSSDRVFEYTTALVEFLELIPFEKHNCSPAFLFDLAHNYNRAESTYNTSHYKIDHSGIRGNEQCPCGSGKRFKHCHGRLRLFLAAELRSLTALKAPATFSLSTGSCEGAWRRR
jgi:glycosyltransferase involved in cell wall biosynthesis